MKSALLHMRSGHMGMGQNLVPLVNIKIAGQWMFIPLKMLLIGIDPYPYVEVIMHEHMINMARERDKKQKAHAY